MLVSIIIPLYNRQQLLPETLNSVLAQTYRHWEVIIVDDGSTDGSQEAAQRYTLQDKRIKFFQRTAANKGASVCRNIGIGQSCGEYLIFLDADDILKADCLAKRVDWMASLPGLDFAVFPRTTFKNVPGETSKTWNLDTPESDLDRFLRNDRSLLTGWLTTSPIWKRSTVLALDGFDETLIDWQDWDIHVRAMVGGYSYEKVGMTPDWFYRSVGNDKISKTNNASILQTKYINRAVMFNKIIQALQAMNAFTTPRKIYMAQNLYHCCAVLVSSGHFSAAKQVLKYLRSIKGIPITTYISILSRLSIKVGYSKIWRIGKRSGSLF